MFLTSNPVAPFGLPDDKDKGINNEGRFKVGSLRSIAEMGRTFHNGDAQCFGGMKNNIPIHGGSLTIEKRSLILTFLQTFTDRALRNDVRFSDPYRKP